MGPQGQLGTESRKSPAKPKKFRQRLNRRCRRRTASLAFFEVHHPLPLWSRAPTFHRAGKLTFDEVLRYVNVGRARLHAPRIHAVRRPRLFTLTPLRRSRGRPLVLKALCGPNTVVAQNCILSVHLPAHHTRSLAGKRPAPERTEITDAAGFVRGSQKSGCEQKRYES